MISLFSKNCLKAIFPTGEKRKIFTFSEKK